MITACPTQEKRRSTIRTYHFDEAMGAAGSTHMRRGSVIVVPQISRFEWSTDIALDVSILRAEADLGLVPVLEGGMK